MPSPHVETPPPAGRRSRIIFYSSEHPNSTPASATQYAIAYLVRRYALSPMWAMVVAEAARIGEGN
jgi:hypothetical protein